MARYRKHLSGNAAAKGRGVEKCVGRGEGGKLDHQRRKAKHCTIRIDRTGKWKGPRREQLREGGNVDGEKTQNIFKPINYRGTPPLGEILSDCQGRGGRGTNWWAFEKKGAGRDGNKGRGGGRPPV